LIILLGVLASLLAQVRSETITYMHTDALGTPVAATDESGNVLWREHYTPFGEKVDKEAASVNNSIGYTGHVNDSDTGLTYMQARYYDPVIGRFYSNDPIGFRDVHSFNRYAYANNNPYKYTDPTGMCSSFAGQEATSDCTPIIEQTTSQQTTNNANGSVTQTRTTTITGSGGSSSILGTIINLPQSSANGAAATPTDSMANSLQNLSESIEKPINVHSGMRTQAQQNSLSGNTSNTVASTSQHTIGNAADISVSGMTGAKLSQAAVNSGAVHVDQKNVGPGTQFYKQWKRKPNP